MPSAAAVPARAAIHAAAFHAPSPEELSQVLRQMAAPFVSAARQVDEAIAANPGDSTLALGYRDYVASILSFVQDVLRLVNETRSDPPRAQGGGVDAAASRSVVLLHGSTGVGKTTFASLLADEEIEFMENDIGEHLVPAVPNAAHVNGVVGGVGVEGRSTTLLCTTKPLPAALFGPNAVCQDSAGTQEPSFVMAFLISLIQWMEAQQADQLKLVLVVTRAAIGDRGGEPLVEQLESLANFVSNLRAVRASVVLIITRTNMRRNERGALRQRLTGILAPDRRMSDTARAVLQDIVDTERFGLFPAPTSDIDVGDDWPPAAIRQGLQQLVASVPYTSLAEFRPPAKLDRGGDTTLNHLASVLIAAIVKELREQIKAGLLCPADSAIEDPDTVSAALRALMTAPTGPDAFVTLSQFMARVNVAMFQPVTMTPTVHRLGQELVYLSLAASTPLHRADWHSLVRLTELVEPCLSRIERLQANHADWFPQRTSYDAAVGLLTVTGYDVTASFVQQQASLSAHQCATSVVVYAVHSVDFDQSLRLPGVDLYLLTPRCRETGRDPFHTIDLSGLDATTPTRVPAPGESGHQGSHGGDGGNFTALIGMDRTQFAVANVGLRVITSGGKGANGQDGAAGAAGVCMRGQLPIIPHVVVPAPHPWATQAPGGVVYPMNEGWVRYGDASDHDVGYRFLGPVGSPGQNGGAGGVNGLGGRPGKITVWFVQEQGGEANPLRSLANSTSVSGEPGLPGASGQGGRGGCNGKWVRANWHLQSDTAFGIWMPGYWNGFDLNLSNQFNHYYDGDKHADGGTPPPTARLMQESDTRGARDQRLQLPALVHAYFHAFNPSPLMWAFTRRFYQQTASHRGLCQQSSFDVLSHAFRALELRLSAVGTGGAGATQGEGETLDFGFLYHTLAHQLHVLGATGTTPRRPDLRALQWLLTKVMSRLCMVRARREASLVVDLREFLEEARSRIGVLERAQKTQAIAANRTAYAAHIEERIRATQAIMRRLKVKVDAAVALLQTEIEGLMADLRCAQAAAVRDVAALSRLEAELKGKIKTRAMMGWVSIACGVACMAIAPPAGIIIGAFVSCGMAMALDAADQAGPQVGRLAGTIAQWQASQGTGENAQQLAKASEAHQRIAAGVTALANGDPPQQLEAVRAALDKTSEFLNEIARAIGDDQLWQRVHSQRQQLSRLSEGVEGQAVPDAVYSSVEVQDALRDIVKHVRRLSCGLQGREGPVIDLCREVEDSFQALLILRQRVDYLDEQALLSDLLALQVGADDRLRHITGTTETERATMRELEVVVGAMYVTELMTRVNHAVHLSKFPFASELLPAANLLPALVEELEQATEEQTLADISSQAIDQLEHLAAAVRLAAAVQRPIHNRIQRRSRFEPLPAAGRRSFCCWHSNELVHRFESLLRGHRVRLYADIANSPAWMEVIKFTSLRLLLRFLDPAIDQAMQALLQRYRVTLEHSGVSYFRYQGQQLRVQGQLQCDVVVQHFVGADIDSDDQLNYTAEILAANEPILAPYTDYEVQLWPENNDWMFNGVNQREVLVRALYASSLEMHLCGMAEYLLVEPEPQPEPAAAPAGAPVGEEVRVEQPAQPATVNVAA